LPSYFASRSVAWSTKSGVLSRTNDAVLPSSACACVAPRRSRAGESEDAPSPARDFLDEDGSVHAESAADETTRAAHDKSAPLPLVCGEYESAFLGWHIRSVIGRKLRRTDGVSVVPSHKVHRHVAARQLLGIGAFFISSGSAPIPQGARRNRGAK
jgi:hypothetical protein